MKVDAGLPEGYRLAHDIARLVKARLKWKGDNITLEYGESKHTPPHWMTVHLTTWRGAIVDMVAYAKREGIDLSGYDVSAYEPTPIQWGTPT